VDSRELEHGSKFVANKRRKLVIWPGFASWVDKEIADGRSLARFMEWEAKKKLKAV
jgi:hypothetical protein